MKTPRFVERPCIKPATITIAFPPKLTARRPQTSCNARKYDPQKLPIVMSAVMMPKVLPEVPNPK
jgi:hypothetical protein